MTNIATTIDAYAQGPQLLREVIERAPESSWDATPIAGKWSIRQVVCHLTDSEIMYTERIKRVLVEEDPVVMEADPNLHVPALTRPERSLPAELAVIEAVRAHMTPVLRSLSEAHFERTVRHSLEGRLSLQTMLERTTAHLPHHLAFIEQKLRVL